MSLDLRLFQKQSIIGDNRSILEKKKNDEEKLRKFEGRVLERNQRA